MALSPYALNTVADFRAYTGLDVAAPTTAVVETLLNAATDLIESYCRRLFVSRQHTELHDRGSDGVVVLHQRPVISVARVSVGKTGALHITFVLANSSEATVSVNPSSTVLTLRSVVSAIVTSTPISLTALATDTLQELATAITAVAGWTASVAGVTYQPYPSADLWPASGVYCKDVQATLYIPSTPETDFEVIHDEGVLESVGAFSWNGGSRVRVVYTAGYTTVPDALAQYCVILAKKMYDAAELDGNLESERLGPYAYTIAKDRQFLDDSIKEGLIPWRNTLV